MPGWNLADVWEIIAARQPEATAIVCGPERLTWAELDRRATAIAGWLSSRRVPRQGKVAQYLVNSSAYLECVFGVLKVSAVPVNTNYRYEAGELLRLWQNADVSAVAFHGQFAETIEKIRHDSGIQSWLWVDDGTGPCPEWAQDYQSLVDQRADPVASSVTRSGEDLVLLYTGGTTGLPKGVMWSQDALFRYFNEGMGGRYAETADLESIRTTPIPARVAHLSACPLMHGTGLFTALRALLEFGTVVIVPGAKFQPRQILDAIQAERVTSLAIVGDGFSKPLLAEVEASPDRWNLSSLQTIVSSGVMFSEDSKRRWLAAVATVTIADVLSSSEALGIARSTTNADSRPGTAQFELTKNAVILSEANRPLDPSPGVVGRLAVRGHIASGYFREAAATDRTFVVIDGDRYCVPGDYAEFDPDGSIVLLGRGSQCINTKGEKVFPEEVEEVLKCFPGVADVAVVGVPSEEYGEMVVALVALAPGEDASVMENLRQSARTQLANFKVPRVLIAVDTVFRSPSGKLDYPQAKAIALDHLAANGAR